MFRTMGFIGVLTFGLSACDEIVVTDNTASTTSPQQTAATPSARQSSRTFVQVQRRVEPVAEAECRARTSNVNCDFLIVIDDRPNQPPNAYQTLDKSGRPIIAFTESIIEDIRNADELAFIMAHEAAHHIRGHIARQQENALAGAVILAGLATLGGADAGAVASARDLGAQVGARSYSKDFELEADELGTIITLKTGYDPVLGSAFFNRIPDPGDRFLGTHPPNAQRVAKVRETAAKF